MLKTQCNFVTTSFSESGNGYRGGASWYWQGSRRAYSMKALGLVFLLVALSCMLGEVDIVSGMAWCIYLDLSAALYCLWHMIVDNEESPPGVKQLAAVNSLNLAE